MPEWEQIRDAVLARARWACQACGARTGLDVHHVRKRSQGGSDFDLDGLVALCRTCHTRTDAAYAEGRLVVAALGEGQFTCEVIQRASKWDDTLASLASPTGRERFAPGGNAGGSKGHAAAGRPVWLPSGANG